MQPQARSVVVVRRFVERFGVLSGGQEPEGAPTPFCIAKQCNSQACFAERIRPSAGQAVLGQSRTQHPHSGCSRLGEGANAIQ